ncbi:hypothetical protein [Thiococcus pfennigii]|uniref:hypothetical protein n=1 Tax=Thiococcus pfennigii TaxID=1057 RepID=UPI001905B5C0|nr:hypothetical protein [Thiococcus pfennigii]MBK1701526.1 hypothetical protein [Thiococcus pfennigii]
MKPRLHPLYTKLLLLAIVFGPFYWLVFTDDGQWRTDTVLLMLFGKPALNLAPERLYAGFDEAAVRERFPKVDLRCGAAATPFGNRLCGAEIGTFNSIPSRRLVLYYGDEGLMAAKIDYRRGYHARLLAWLTRRLGAPETGADGTTATWPADEGLVVARAGELGADEEPTLLWLSHAVLAQ